MSGGDPVPEVALLLASLASRIAPVVRGHPADELTVAQALVLRALRPGPLSVGGLAARLGRSLPVATRATNLLVARGLVERRPDRADRRVRWVSLTERGRAAERRAVAVAGQRFRARFDGLPAATLGRIRALLQELDALLAAETRPPSTGAGP